MKIGLSINIISGGISEHSSYNVQDKWVRHIVDARDLLKRAFLTSGELRNSGAVSGEAFDGSGKVVYLLQLLGKEGYLIGIAKAISQANGRSYDGTVAWLYFPFDIDIDGATAVSVIERVRDAISDPVEINKSLLADIMNHEYSVGKPKMCKVLTHESGATEVGVVRYGGSMLPLDRYLGDYVYQSQYCRYKAIVLADIELGLAINSTASIITEIPQKGVLIPPPGVHDGFTPMVEGLKWTHPVEVLPGQTISVVWKRPGWQDVEKTIDSTGRVPLPTESEEYRNLEKKCFHIKDEWNQPVSGASLWINGRPFEGDTLALSARELARPLDVTVYVDGYEEVKLQLRIDDRFNYKDISLKRRIHHYEFEIPAYDDNGEPLQSPLKAVLDSKKPLRKSPIKGYESEYGEIEETTSNTKRPRINRLEYKKKKRQRIVFHIGSFILGAIAGALFSSLALVGVYTLWLKPHSEETVQETPVSTPGPSTSVEEQVAPAPAPLPGEEDSAEIRRQEDKARALAYLTSNEKWHRDSLEKYEYTRGLFDALNYGDRIGELRTYWVDSLSGTEIDRIADYLKYTHPSAIRIDWGSEGNTFNISQDDKEITMSRYVSKMLERTREENGVLKKPSTQGSRGGRRSSGNTESSTNTDLDT